MCVCVFFFLFCFFLNSKYKNNSKWGYMPSKSFNKIPECFWNRLLKKPNIYNSFGGACGLIFVVSFRHGDPSSNPGQGYLHFTNTLGKGMDAIILPPAMEKIVVQTGLFNLDVATSLGKNFIKNFLNFA